MLQTKVTPRLTEYPKTWHLGGGLQVTVRPMTPDDRDALVAFFQSVPAEDLQFLKEDVTQPEVIDGWIEHLDYDRVLPLVAEVNGRIVADATLHRRREGWRRHLGGLRIVVDPEFRELGLASRLIDELVDVATDEGLERAYVEIPTDATAAMEVFEERGFKKVAVFERNIIDLAGQYHDLAVLHLDLADWTTPV
jgi:RimJ/RimL family protein N-acetyltransferase